MNLTGKIEFYNGLSAKREGVRKLTGFSHFSVSSNGWVDFGGKKKNEL